MSLFINRFITAILSTITFSFLYSCFTYNSFYENFFFRLIYLSVIYIFIGIPISLIIDTYIVKNYKGRFFVYSLFGVLVGSAVSFLLFLDGFPWFLILYSMILGFVASNVFLHINIILCGKNSFRFS